MLPVKARQNGMCHPELAFQVTHPLFVLFSMVARFKQLRAEALYDRHHSVVPYVKAQTSFMCKVAAVT